jgi:hypothetical protein
VVDARRHTPPKREVSMQCHDVATETIGPTIQNEVAAITHGGSGASPLALKNKVTLGYMSPDSPSLASFNNHLYIAWKGDVANTINIVSSDDNGHILGAIFSSREICAQAPALCIHDGMLFVAWASAKNCNLNVARVNLTGSRITGLANHVVLPATSLAKAYLASFNGALYIAWKGAGNGNLELMYSTDNGATFGNRYTSSETSTHGPGLAAHNGNLYIAWKGSRDDRLNVALVHLFANEIIGLANKIILSDISPDSPSLASLCGRLSLLWRGDVSRSLNIEYSSDNGGSFADRCRYLDASHHAPALCAHNGGLFISWTDRENEHINIAQISSRVDL